MPEYRTRPFDVEAPKIGRVIANLDAPLQLSLDEQLLGRVHGWDRIEPTDYGYIARCRCGWCSRELPFKRSAQYELRAHIGRTPQGTAALRSLRKLGRSGNGS